MLYGKYIDELINRLKLDIKNDADRIIAGQKINSSYKEVANVASVTWEPLKRYGEMVATPNYTTGFCDITNGSRTINFSGGTALTSAMEGRFFRSQSGSNWYKIIKVLSPTQAILLSPIVEDTAATRTFTIWKRYYYFPSEVKRLLDFGSWIRDGVMTERSNQFLSDMNFDLSMTGEPVEFTMFGVDPFEGSYSDGTITVTKNSNLATGTGTLWLSSVEAGDIMEVGTSVYRVKRVESDTTIRLLNFATTTGTTLAYTIRKDQNLGCQLWYNSNRSYILPFYYVKRAYDMVNETYDRPELPEEFDKAILDGAEADRLSDLDDPRAQIKIQMFASRMLDLRSTRYVSQPRFRQLRPKIDDRRGSYF